ncbi:uncharacterized protein EV420DRAFT_1648856 [Desarmillaria tabescens]|uniref:DUF6533 domain-containing protein n=1 Tax=Armillaria tabescens TaxID=1929756 RepID=A0AA39JKR9_ARMTA|nr:uncharacterized protein EV420DRAFT_1648856 [Desarmillaria tabescens]KAK0444565.1 hypothetical protein EV420DRAFT_1648856 [Desarmillaria tabescens]
MSMIDSDSLRSEYKDLNVNYYLSLVAFSILYYDYALTFALEVSRFWVHRGFSWAAFFFYLNRYLGIFGHAPVVMEYFWTGYASNKAQRHVKFRCLKLQTYHQYFVIIVQIVVAVMLIMRTYALYDRSRKILIVQIGVAVTATILGAYAVASGKKTSPDADPADIVPSIGCSTSLTKDSAARLGIAWCGMLVFDIMVFTLTLHKALQLQRAGGVNLLTLLLRDGSVYFGVIVVSNLVNILTFFLGNAHIRGVFTTFTNVISSTMLSRLMLNIRDPKLLHTPLSTTVTEYPMISTFVDSPTRLGPAAPASMDPESHSRHSGTQH